MGHERPIEPFSDLHVEHGHVRATLLHDPTVEGLDVGLYLDGSSSMSDEYMYTQEHKPRSLWQWLTGQPKLPTAAPSNQVEPQARWILRYLASKDRNGLLRVAYWACGPGGTQVEPLGELSGANVDQYTFGGPRVYGQSTKLAPAIHDYIRYLKGEVANGARRGLAVFITDGQLHDADEVHALTAEIAGMITRGQLPRLNLVLVGVGDAIDEEQLERIAHAEHPGVGHLWCHRTAKEIQNVAELVAVLVDETMTVAAGGTIYDDRGRIVKAYEGRLPAVLEFEVAEGCQSFTLEVSGQRFTQPMPADHDDDDDDDHGGGHH
jgi:hypothetical protein